MKTKLLKSVFIVSCILLLSAGSAWSQWTTVTGKVTEAGTTDPLAGVTVRVKGKNTATTTDLAGAYRISAGKGEQLVFSFVGCRTKIVTITKSVHNVQLEPEPAALSEAVVVGYASQKKSNLTGSVAISYRADKSISKEQQCLSPAPAQYVDQEEYGHFVENRFKSAKEDPLSTFSIDVDAASYSNMRRFINQGKLPEKDAVRTEELVNYFSYNYEKATGKDPIKINTEIGECPWNKQYRLVKIGIKAREIPSDNLAASNLVFLIDVSGSMQGPERLELVKSSLKLLVNNLREKDRVAIVVYAGAAGTVLPSTSGSDKQKIRESLESLQAGGSTAGGAGIKLAYAIAKKNFIPQGNNRIILCTDGDFNVGASSNQELESLIETERKSGVFLTILGYGMGNYKDSKMQILAEKGNGNHAYIDNLQEANKVLVNEFGGTIYTVAKDVKLQIEFNPAKVQSYRLIGYESRLLNKEDFNDDTKDAGEMGAGHCVTAFYEVVPVGVPGPGSVDPLKYQSVPFKPESIGSSPDLLTVKLRYKQPDGDKSVKLEVPVIDRGENNVSSDFRFAAAVAMFGQILRNSDFKGSGTYDQVISLAKSGLNDDLQGYRREFIRLAETAKGMTGK